MAFLAYYFNWSHDTVLSLPHGERELWCSEVSRINEKVSEREAPGPHAPVEPSIEEIPVAEFDEDGEISTAEFGDAMDASGDEFGRGEETPVDEFGHGDDPFE